MSPTDDLTFDVGEEELALSIAAAPGATMGTLELSFVGGEPGMLSGSLTSQIRAGPGDDHFMFRGMCNISVGNDEHNVPVEGKLELREQEAGRFRVRLFFKGRNQQGAAICLRCRGRGEEEAPGTISGRGRVRVGFIAPDDDTGSLFKGTASFSINALGTPN